MSDLLVEAARSWAERLAGAPVVLDLPADRRRPRDRSGAVGSVEFTLESELVEAIRDFAGHERSDTPTALVASLLTVLHRISGQDDILIALRRWAWSSNTTVIRSDMSAQPTVKEMLRRTDAVLHDAAECRDVSLEKIVEAVQPAPIPGIHPLVQVLVDLEPPAGSSCLSPDGGPFDFDLRVAFPDSAAPTKGRLDFATDLFDEDTIERLVAQWKMSLHAMGTEPETLAHHVVLSRPDEIRRMLRDWSSGGDIEAGPDVLDLIDERVTAQPDAIAISGIGEPVTYRELDERSDRLARCLRSAGVGPEVLVAVFLPRCSDQIVALLGVLKSGGGYVPIDTDAPDERVRYAIADTKTPIVVTHSGLVYRLGGLGVDRIELDHLSLPDEIQPSPARAEERAGTAYVLYTSGSTGHPKGVVVDRHVLSAHCRAMIGVHGLGPDDRVLQFSHYTFDVSIEQILPTLAAGARIVMRGDEIWAPHEFLDEIRDRGITVMNLTPAYFNQVVREWAGSGRSLEATRLRLVIVGGDRLGEKAVAHWKAVAAPETRLLNAYGPTETVITTTLADVVNDHGPITIGRPIPGRRVYILDSAGRPAPVGVVGELYIGGPVIGQGYLGKPELTSERFLPNPFADGERFYRSGDLARYLGDGRICYVGRRDHQVKIRGFRIELGEIEAALEGHPCVVEAVVAALGEGNSKELVAYVTGSLDAVSEEDLKDHLRAKLPAYMQPAVIVLLEEMPRFANGKTDRRRLPAPERTTNNTPGQFRSPEGLTEYQLLNIWEELIPVRPIGTDDSFFDLGGHSLLAAELLGRIESVFARRLKLSTLFANPTIGQLAKVLQSAEQLPHQARALAVQPNGARRPMFFLHGDWTGGAFYCFALARECGADQPFYVIEPHSFDATSGAPSIVDMASRHIETMRRVQPQGPYRLGGFCNGGLLAYEMARQLESEGDRVEFLGLVNPVSPNQDSLVRSACEWVGRLTRFVGWGATDVYLRFRHAGRHLYRLVRPAGSRVADFAKLLVVEPRLESAFPPRQALYRDYVGVFDWAVSAYRPRKYSGPATFFWAKEEPGVDAGWRPILATMQTGQIEEFEVDGNLMSSVTDHAEGMGGLLGDCLNRLEENRR